MDQAVLITDYWQAQENIEQWGLVNFEGDKPIVYAFTSTNGFWLRILIYVNTDSGQYEHPAFPALGSVLF